MIYSESVAKNKLVALDNWLFVNDALEKKYIFKDFKTALAFLNSVGLIAEKLHHHPEIHNLYNKVQLRLNTHDVGGVTEKDFELATAIDAIP